MGKLENIVQKDQEGQFLDDINHNIGIVHRVCNSYFFDDFDERQDLFQEIMYQLWKSYPSFQGNSKFSTWMYKVALNTAITYRKREGKAPAKERLTEKLEQMPDFSDQAYKEERIMLLYRAINTLTAIDRAIILLYLDDNSYDEIASVTGITKNNVSVRLVRVKKALQEKLKIYITT